MNGGPSGLVLVRANGKRPPATIPNKFGFALIKSNVLCSILLVKINHSIGSACNCRPRPATTNLCNVKVEQRQREKEGEMNERIDDDQRSRGSKINVFDSIHFLLRPNGPSRLMRAGKTQKESSSQHASFMLSSGMWNVYSSSSACSPVGIYLVLNSMCLSDIKNHFGLLCIRSCILLPSNLSTHAHNTSC